MDDPKIIDRGEGRERRVERGQIGEFFGVSSKWVTSAVGGGD